MKTRLKIFMWGLVMIFSTAQAMDFMDLRLPPKKYNVDHQLSKVYFSFNEIVGADVKTFTVLDEHLSLTFAKDKNHLYFEDKVMNFSHPSNIQYLGNGVFKDTEHVYLKDNVILGADAKTYRVVLAEESKSPSYGYGKDDYSVFYYMDKRDDIDAGTFRLLNNKYAKDKNSVYFWGKKIEKSDGLSFVLLSESTGKDKHNVYYNSRIIEGADPGSYELLNQNGKLNGKLNVYGNPTTNYGYAKDKNHAYYNGKVIVGAHLASFRERIYGYAEDKNRIYYDGRVVENANPKTFIEPPNPHIDL